MALQKGTERCWNCGENPAAFCPKLESERLLPNICWWYDIVADIWPGNGGQRAIKINGKYRDCTTAACHCDTAGPPGRRLINRSLVSDQNFPTGYQLELSKSNFSINKKNFRKKRLKISLSQLLLVSSHRNLFKACLLENFVLKCRNPLAVFIFKILNMFFE